MIQKTNVVPCVLTIAGSDPSGGAGIQADTKAISATGSYAASVITAITMQNTMGVHGIYAVPAAIVTQQISAVLADLDICAIKIGMVYNKAIMQALREILHHLHAIPIVLDPVMIAKGGNALLKKSALKFYSETLFQCCTLVTPNIPEAQQLAGKLIKHKDDMAMVAALLGHEYQTNFLIKGGHLNTVDCDDVLFTYADKKLYWFNTERVNSKNTHGTGCTLSSAIASYLAQKQSLQNSVAHAKQYVTQAIAASTHWQVGHGIGPLHHFYFLDINEHVF